MDYGRVAASLRRKAASNGVTPDEAAALLAKAAELEAKYGTTETPPDPPKRTYAPPSYYFDPPALRFMRRAPEVDIVEDGYRWQPDDY